MVWGRTKEEHDKILKKVFQKLAENIMALSIEKCKFNQAKVDYLGYEVTDTGIRPLPRKLEALKDFKEPTCQKDVLQFLRSFELFQN